MTSDFGGARRGGGFPIGIAAVLVVGLIAAGLWFWSVPRWVAEARHWTVQGPPCRQVSAGQFEADSAGAPMQMDTFDDIEFGRAYGHVSCSDIHDDGGHGMGMHPVCQFSSPTRVSVRTAKGGSHFEADPGQPVTISVLKGRVECVIGGDEWTPGKS